LNEELRFESSGGFIFIGVAGTGGEKGVYFVDEDDTWRESFGKSE